MKILRTLVCLAGLLLWNVAYAGYFKVGGYYSGGNMVSLDVKDHFIYTTRWDGLFEIIDVADPQQPVLVGSLWLTDNIPGGGGGVKVCNTMAFVSGESQVHLIDISDPSFPAYVGNINEGLSRDILISDTLLYLAGFDMLRIFNISNVLSPVLLGQFGGSFNGICKKDSLIFGISSGSPENLQVINVADPSSPELVGSLEFGIGSNAGIDISGNSVFIAAGISVWSVDVNDPANPFVLDTLVMECYTSRIHIDGDLAVINNETAGIKIIDVSSPQEMQDKGFYDTPSIALTCRLAGNAAYVADGYSGLQIIDVSEPFNEYLVGTFPSTGKAAGIGKSGDNIFMGDGYYGLAVVNVADPANPVLITTCLDGLGTADNVTIQGDKLCFSTSYPWPGPALHFVDISDPGNPQLLKTIDYTASMLYGSLALFQTNGTLFVGTETSVDIFDISDFSNPQLVGQYPTPGPVMDMILSGDHLSVALGMFGVLILDVSNPAQPQYSGNFDTPGNSVGLAVRSDTLIVSDYGGGFLIVSVTDPLTPTVLGSYKPHPDSKIFARPVIVDNELIITDFEWNEVFTYKITNLSSISLESSYRINTQTRQYIAGEGLFYCSNYYHGLSILDHSVFLNVENATERDEDLANLKIYPNPCREGTLITYSLFSKSMIRISIINSFGETIRVLMAHETEAGSHQLFWDGTDTGNTRVPPGIYMVNLNDGSRMESCKVIRQN